ncbi:site-specific DNA tyrosine recombinase, XerD [Rhodopirellula maiorica SM1]|uniref:Site-specific DNA tyrosine recombinase, XerD n=1 Tax=Rhodopirellula maiorica SM1 TaxID=1265738 RepID=M5RM49_9BACT|nr:site-specific DNA tyrosine recombinase, XerD [Rhodopirellula maiorica SM1]
MGSTSIGGIGFQPVMPHRLVYFTRSESRKDVRPPLNIQNSWRVFATERPFCFDRPEAYPTFSIQTRAALAKRPTKLELLQKAGPPPKSNRATETVCNEFLDYLRSECHLAANTIAAYGRDIQRFATWLGTGSLNQISISDLSSYIGELNEAELAPASIARNVVAVRTFFKYLQLEGIVQSNPAELIVTQKMWQRIPGVLSTRQVEQFLSSPRKADVYWQRDVAMLEVLYATGCRASEVCSIRVRDMSLSEKFLKCEGKGGSNASCRSVRERSQRSIATAKNCAAS